MCIRAVAAANWVQPEKRERKQRVDYNQDKYFRGAMGTVQAGRSDCFSLFFAGSSSSASSCSLPSVPPLLLALPLFHLLYLHFFFMTFTAFTLHTSSGPWLFSGQAHHFLLFAMTISACCCLSFEAVVRVHWRHSVSTGCLQKSRHSCKCHLLELCFN